MDTTELNRKTQRLKELATLLSLQQGKTMTREQQMEHENWQGKLAFRLAQLVTESKIKELDIKIEVYEGMLNTLKHVQ